MRNAVQQWTSCHTTSGMLIALLVLVGSALIVTGTYILVEYPRNPDKAPIQFLVLLGFAIVNYGAHRHRVNELMADLRKIIDADSIAQPVAPEGRR